MLVFPVLCGYNKQTREQTEETSCASCYFCVVRTPSIFSALVTGDHVNLVQRNHSHDVIHLLFTLLFLFQTCRFTKLGYN